METITQWKNSINWRALLLLVVVAFPVALLHVGRSPLSTDVATVLEDGSLLVPIQVKLLWRSLELDTVHVFRIDGELIPSQVTALKHAAARRVHWVLRVIALALSVVLFVIFRRRLASIKTIRMPMRRGLLLAVGAGVVVIQILASHFGSGSADSNLLSEPEYFWSLALSTILVAPLFEEFYYRRFVQTSLDALHVPWYLSVVLVAVYFGLSHSVAPMVALQLMIFAMVAGLAYQVTGKLWVPVGLHIALNVWSLTAKLNGS